MKCSRCGSKNTEYSKFKVWWIVPVRVCQSCVSKMFRGFVKGK